MQRLETTALLLIALSVSCAHGKDVLSHDVILDAPMRLAAGTTLDCGGHSISATRKGVPDVGIYVDGVSGVRVVNCTLRGFDFGVVIAGAKSTEVTGNDITTRIGVEIVASEATVVRDNTIRYGNGANGIGIVAWGDSDNSVFRNNRVVATAVDTHVDGPQWPGAATVTMRSDGIRSYSGTQARTVINVIVGGSLRQFVSDATTKQTGTIIEGNDVDIPDADAYAIVVADQVDSVVRGNTVRRALHGLHVSGMQGMLKPAGTCTGNRLRYCLEPRDCFLPGIDQAAAGSCEAPPPMYSFSTSTGLRFIGNHILGPLTQRGFDCVIDVECGGVRPAGIAVYPNAVGIVVDGNDVANSEFAGINLLLKSVESAIVTNNIVRDSAYSLAFQSVPPDVIHVERADHFGAVITHNDFIGHRWRAVYASKFFTLPAELNGNYWGHSCGETLDVREGIADNHPFGEPVARTLGSKQPCR